MVIHNSINNAFGPAGRWAGIFLILAGLIILLLFRSIPGLIPIIMGAFTGFTREITSIDFQRKKVRNGWKIMGIIPTGDWVTISPQMQIMVKKSNRVWTTYSRGNVPLDVKEDDFVLVLIDQNKREIMPLQRAPNIEEADQQMMVLERKLDMVRFTKT